jgi:hypothetical protein
MREAVHKATAWPVPIMLGLLTTVGAHTVFEHNLVIAGIEGGLLATLTILTHAFTAPYERLPARDVGGTFTIASRPK